MSRSHESVVQAQFGPRARAYVESGVHAAGADLDALGAIARHVAPRRALDLGTGGGHVAYRLAGVAASVVACDLSAEMVAAVSTAAEARGLANVETCLAAAEDLPFAGASFDLLACRFSAHHWRDFDAGLREARRVLEPGARAVFIDTISPGQAALDTHLQAIELLRDASHVRNRTAAEWLAALTRAGFAVQATAARRLRMEFASWIRRMQTPPVHEAAIRSLQGGAAAETIAHYEIGTDGSFTLDTLQLDVTAA